MSVPYLSGHSMYLRGVSAVSSSLAWAVGFDGSSPLIYKWNGTAWSFDNPPAGLTAQLRAVSAISFNDVWAVGSTGAGNTGDTVILHWNGTSWGRVTSPNPGTNNGLSGVKTVSSNLAYAVGSYDSGSGAQTLALIWNGTSWNTEISANPHTTDQLEAVDPAITGCTGGDIWAVGHYNTGSGFNTLIMQYTIASPCRQ